MYRATPHSITGVHLTDLLFKKEQRNKLTPTVRPEPYWLLDKTRSCVSITSWHSEQENLHTFKQTHRVDHLVSKSAF